MPTAPLTGSRYPASTDVPNVPQFIQNAVYDLEDNTVPRFANATARTTAFNAWVAAGNTLTDGLLCYMQDDHRLWRYDGVSNSWTWVKTAQGVIGYQPYQPASNAGLSPTFTTLPVYTIASVTIPANRRIRVSFSTTTISTDATHTVGWFTLYMNQGSGGPIASVYVDMVLQNVPYSVFREVYQTPAAGNWQFQVGFQRQSAGGTTAITTEASALVVEDMGAAS